MILENIANKHSDIRLNGVTNSIGDSGIGIVNVVNACQISLVVNSNINDATVGIGEGNDLFI